MSRRLAYADYLKSDQWRLTREGALRRAGHRCQSGKCQMASLFPHEIAEFYTRSEARLEVHHLTYERLGCEAPDDLLVLCGLCHGMAHGVHAERPSGPIPLAEIIAALPAFRRSDREGEL